MTAKGLEFDGVIVVEPTAIHADGPQGPRLLFVALTRAVQHLVLLHLELRCPPRLAADHTQLRVAAS